MAPGPQGGRGLGMARFALVGVGWRAEFFRRAALAVPDRLSLVGAVARSHERAEQVEASWGVPVFADLGSMLRARRPDFVVLSVPWALTVGLLEALAGEGVPVLCETPPAPDVAGLLRVCEMARTGPPVQVAEQYQFQPFHAARLALTDAGAIGRVSMASLSFAHGYHCFSLMRRHLGVGGEPATLRASVVRASVDSGASRDGPRTARASVEEVRTVSLVDFGDRLGVYDFADTQYRSYVRSQRVHLRGSDGEITDHELHKVIGLDERVTVTLRREASGVEGDLDGHYLRAISGADGWLWRTPFPGARLADDEIAVATCLELMGRHVEGGPAFYGIADAAQDHYLYLALQDAAARGEPVRTERQPWEPDMLVGT